MTDLFARTQAEFYRHRGDFLQHELDACSRSIEVASTMWLKGDRKLAEKALAEGQAGYAGLQRMMSDPAQTRRLSIKVKQELTGKMKALGARLEALQRSRT